LRFPRIPNRRNENVGEDNLQRMIKLADEFFETKNDPDQITVSEEVMSMLQKIHPATLSEKRDENGPCVWILVLPTTLRLMEEFLAEQINERELLGKTPIGATYDAVYLCSALVLPEHRGKGLARGLAADAVRSIQQAHPIRCLFYWPFSTEGEKLANSIARELNLPLRRRSSH
jgi:GNAT superfamily N-acetyltransferase